MKPAKKRASPITGPDVTVLLRRYNKLKEAAIGALRLMRTMEEDQALRLPFPRYEDVKEALRKELE